MQPKIYSLKDHQISSKKIDTDAAYVIHKLRSSGYEAYLVGGSVRDLLLRRKPKDFDISTSAKPDEIKVLFRKCLLIGRRFRLAHVRFGKKILEVSTFRSGDPTTDDLIIRDNVWGTAEEDVLRRDFTINGLFYDPEEEIVIDYVGGVEDALQKKLRTIGQAEIRFRQDPVRMIRLLKFKARFDFEIDAESKKALYICKEQIMKSSQARILEELLRMLESGSCEKFIRYLNEYGLLELLIPSLAKYLNRHLVDNLIYAYLSEIDNKSWQDLTHTLERPILLSCLIFPILQEKISFVEKKISLHLGKIAEIASQLIYDTFHPFFHIPRRIKMMMVSILISQFRFVPLHEKHFKTLRVPKDPCFFLAFKFFKLRIAVEPQHLKRYTQWSEAIFQYKKRKKTDAHSETNLL